MAEAEKRPVEPNVFFALGVVGAVVFLVGIFRPVLGRLPYGGYLSIAVAAGGGALAVFGFSRWYDARHPQGPSPEALAAERDGVRQASSFEIYDPRSEDERSPPSPRESPRPPP
ncbi:MAG: hypothetical protein L3J87_04810 [Thermoplasmata archaeon]|nr:hypothetical protein [Thermoplasmata archaeon]MCI4344926.1 hypothetical protein [Thermoplasmata archaeon]